MSNITFNYLYRDGSNYKKWAEVVFSNVDGLPAELITRQLRESFLEDGLFIAHQVRIPEVFLAQEYSLTEDDHCFHEFADAEVTPDAPNDTYGRSIREFVVEVAREANKGWRAFDPLARLTEQNR